MVVLGVLGQAICVTASLRWVCMFVMQVAVFRLCAIQYSSTCTADGWTACVVMATSYVCMTNLLRHHDDSTVHPWASARAVHCCSCLYHVLQVDG